MTENTLMREITIDERKYKDERKYAKDENKITIN